MYGTVFIARHGERLDFADKEWHLTAENKNNPPLTKKGIRQASKLGEFLKDRNIKHIFVSPFLRTLQTAWEVAKIMDLSLNIEWGASEWLNEDWFGLETPQWEDESSACRQFKVNTSYVRQWDKKTYPESRDMVRERCFFTVKTLAEKYCKNGDGILIVGHGLIVEFMSNGLVPDEKANWATYCCLTECVPCDDDGKKWKMVLNCEDSFLKDEAEKTPPHYV